MSALLKSSPSDPPWIALVGPTASGKSALALALAEQLRPLPTEIISLDSALVYRHMNIGTAKPTPAERQQVPHHLIDILEPTQSYSAAQFVSDAKELIAQIHARGALPLVVGGTMLYLKALIQGLDAMPSADLALRQIIQDEAQHQGWPAMHAQLAQIDPMTAARLAPHDAQRISRALEVWRATGTPLSQYHQPQSLDSPTPVYAPQCFISLEPDQRRWLHQRIEQRFEQMMANGFMEEMRLLRSMPALHPDLPSMRCVGYRQAWEAMDAGLQGEALQRTITEKTSAATRQLAKRQLTWLRSMPQRQIVACDQPFELVIQKALAILQRDGVSNPFCAKI
jgi:tRNA dimethylallyltransferase